MESSARDQLQFCWPSQAGCSILPATLRAKQLPNPGSQLCLIMRCLQALTARQRPSPESRQFTAPHSTSIPFTASPSPSALVLVISMAAQMGAPTTTSNKY